MESDISENEALQNLLTLNPASGEWSNRTVMCDSTWLSTPDRTGPPWSITPAITVVHRELYR